MLLGQFFSWVTWMTQSANDSVGLMSQELHLGVWNPLWTSFKYILLDLVNLKLFIPWTTLLLYLLSSTCCVTHLNVNIFKWKCLDAKQSFWRLSNVWIWYFVGGREWKGNLRPANHKLNIHYFNWVPGAQTYYLSIRTSFQMFSIMAYYLNLCPIF